MSFQYIQLIFSCLKMTQLSFFSRYNLGHFMVVVCKLFLNHGIYFILGKYFAKGFCIKK